LSTSDKTGNVQISATFQSVRVTIVAVEKQKLLHVLNVYLQP